jgi:chromosomal replication initiator protein
MNEMINAVRYDRVLDFRERYRSVDVLLVDDIQFLAGKIKSNIRELEGSLIRLIAFASLTGQELSLSLAQEVLKNILDHEEKAVTIDAIQKFVAEYYNLKLADLKSRNNSKSVAMPRQIAMYLCKSLTHASLPEIGRSFGGKHHSTVIHSIRKVEELRKKDLDFNSQISNFLEGFR